MRDSTRSNEELWVYERDHYASYILIHKGEPGKQNTDLEAYGAYITEQGGSAEQNTIGDVASVDLSYMQDNKECRETVFIYRDILYSVALRGGSEQEFTALKNSIAWRTQ